jgi:hypothetical protein
MNQIVRSWIKYQERPKYDGPDSVDIDGEKLVIGDDMAERKKKDLGPHFGSFKPVYEQPSGALDSTSFNNVIRMIKIAESDRVFHLRHATFTALRKLRVARDLDEAVSGMPKGSSQADFGSIITWIKSIAKDDTSAVNQLLAIDATCCVRTS